MGLYQSILAKLNQGPQPITPQQIAQAQQQGQQTGVAMNPPNALQQAQPGGQQTVASGPGGQQQTGAPQQQGPMDGMVSGALSKYYTNQVAGQTGLPWLAGGDAGNATSALLNYLMK